MIYHSIVTSVYMVYCLDVADFGDLPFTRPVVTWTQLSQNWSKVATQSGSPGLSKTGPVYGPFFFNFS